MEITTTMVRFPFPKSGMEIQTNDAQLFICKNNDKKEKVWVPFKKLSIKDGDDNHNIVVMPKWLFLKGVLPLYTEYEEFIVKTEVNPI